MQINATYQPRNPNFKQIRYSTEGELAMGILKKYNPRAYGFLRNDIKNINADLPITKFWDMEIDGIYEYSEPIGQYMYNFLYKYIHKPTGKKFEDLLLGDRPTRESAYSVPNSMETTCYSGQTLLPPEMVLFTNKYSNIHEQKRPINEIVFDLKNHNDADSKWEDLHSNRVAVESEVRVYYYLEKLSEKYESSINESIEDFVKRLKRKSYEMRPNEHDEEYKIIDKKPKFEELQLTMPELSEFSIEKLTEYEGIIGKYTKITLKNGAFIIINNVTGNIVKEVFSEGGYKTYNACGHLIEGVLPNGTNLKGYRQYDGNIGKRYIIATYPDGTTKKTEVKS